MTDAVFPPDAARFLRELARHNDREWFQANRDRYTAAIRRPLEALLADAAARYGEGRIMRPNRDVRFTPDKSPYRTDASLYAGGVYLRLDAGGVEAGGGLYEPSRDQLGRARAVIDGEEPAARSLQRIVDRLEREGFELAGPALRTAPRGFARDHPGIGLLRLRHYAGLQRLAPDASRADVHRAWRAVEPLIEWTREHVGPAVSWP